MGHLMHYFIQCYICHI